jgi:hypothetical protein
MAIRRRNNNNGCIKIITFIFSCVGFVAALATIWQVVQPIVMITPSVPNTSSGGITQPPNTIYLTIPQNNTISQANPPELRWIDYAVRNNKYSEEYEVVIRKIFDSNNNEVNIIVFADRIRVDEYCGYDRGLFTCVLHSDHFEIGTYVWTVKHIKVPNGNPSFESSQGLFLIR